MTPIRWKYARQMADKVLCEDSDMVVGDRLSSTYYQESAPSP